MAPQTSATFHESLNLAGVWKLPVVWICENNQYGMGTAVDRASAVSEMIRKAHAYGMEGKQVDGMNVFEVYKATQEALQAIRAGAGPQFLEMITYRFEGHSMGDPLRYRTKDEVEKWRADDPIGILERHLLEQGIATQQELDQLDTAVDAELAQAVQFAEESPLPALEELYTDIYVDTL
jgi:Pyruvate/2-oxoglutarate dehydrogenase complex, dehydrogenase (E1) component, eukaryotic type, alpha subunit